MLHEFATIPGVREDVTDLILNIKGLVLKLHSSGTRYARIEKQGPCTVTGGDIIADPDIETVSYTHLGLRTIDLDRAAEEFIRSKGAIPTFKGYMGFPGSICASKNEVVVHGVPGETILEEGDIISIRCV